MFDDQVMYSSDFTSKAKANVENIKTGDFLCRKVFDIYLRFKIYFSKRKVTIVPFNRMFKIDLAKEIFLFKDVTNNTTVECDLSCFSEWMKKHGYYIAIQVENDGYKCVHKLIIANCEDDLLEYYDTSLDAINIEYI